jgi:hypothetical protein
MANKTKQKTHQSNNRFLSRNSYGLEEMGIMYFKPRKKKTYNPDYYIHQCLFLRVKGEISTFKISTK